MKIANASPTCPIYIIQYLYDTVPWTLHSYNFHGMGLFCENDTTQEGTSDYDLAKKVADALLSVSRIETVMVKKSNGNGWEEVYSVKK
jgi:hypothetical protein